MSEPTRDEIDIEVRYAETDQMGVVHHANYLVWFELARTSLCTRTGYHYADIERLGYLLMVSGIHASYRGAARYGDTIKVTSWVDRLASRALNFAYEVRRDGEILVSGVSEHVWVDLQTRKHCRIPEELQGPFERLAGVPP